MRMNCQHSLKLFDDAPFLKWHPNNYQEEVSQTRRRKQSYQNINLTNNFNLVGKYELPQVNPYIGEIPSTLTPYSMKNTGNKGGAVHFFIDDYRFTGMFMWGNLQQYTEKVAPYKMVIAPDFSVYLDQSRTLNLFQLYQNRFVSAYWQSVGLQVIPSVSWGNADSFEYCFEGLPKHSVLAIGGLGNAHHSSMIQLWEYGVKQTIERLNPTALIIYGAPIQIELPVETHYYQSFINSKFA